MSSVVIVYDVSPVVRTGDVDRIRYRGSGVIGVTKTTLHHLCWLCLIRKWRSPVDMRYYNRLYLRKKYDSLIHKTHTVCGHKYAMLFQQVLVIARVYSKDECNEMFPVFKSIPSN